MTTITEDAWVLTRDRTFHASVCNIPPGEWIPARTLCFLRDEVTRVGRAPSARERHRTCTLCLDELEELGEVLPSGLRKGKRNGSR